MSTRKINALPNGASLAFTLIGLEGLQEVDLAFSSSYLILLKEDLPTGMATYFEKVFDALCEKVRYEILPRLEVKVGKAP